MERRPVTPPGLMIAAPRSSAGKTTVALGLMRAFARKGVAVRAFKNGPDYIDPAFHRAATGFDSFNLDSWAMTRGLMRDLVASAEGADLILAEGSMGLFDGAGTTGAVANGASADLAALFGWPVVLVVDASGQAQSAAATALGCRELRPDVTIAGVVLNRIASDRHDALVREAMAGIGMPVFGTLRRNDELTLPERHLGLVQADEIGALDAHLDRLADQIVAACDLSALRDAARAVALGEPGGAVLAPPGQRIALARDAAFTFIYPHLLAAWRRAGAEIVPFSPLADEAPPADCDCCWLPGGYPELHAGELAAAPRFLDGLRAFAASRPVHGECGGFMVLGAGLEDAGGETHAMAGLLGHTTSFAKRRIHLGYRRAELLADCLVGPAGTVLRGHEFHYATVTDPGMDVALALLSDGHGNDIGTAGARRGSVTGTFFHVIAADG